MMGAPLVGEETVTRRRELGYVILTIAIVGLAVGIAYTRTSDVTFSRRVFTGLANGSRLAQPHIAWEDLRAMGVDAGGTYRALPNDWERSQYRQAFIQYFSSAFKQQGATPRSFTRWRVDSKAAGQVVVAADYPAMGKTLLITSSRARPKRVQTIVWKE